MFVPGSSGKDGLLTSPAMEAVKSLSWFPAGESIWKKLELQLERDDEYGF